MVPDWRWTVGIFLVILPYISLESPKPDPQGKAGVVTDILLILTGIVMLFWAYLS